MKLSSSLDILLSSLSSLILDPEVAHIRVLTSVNPDMRILRDRLIEFRRHYFILKLNGYKQLPI